MANLVLKTKLFKRLSARESLEDNYFSGANSLFEWLIKVLFTVLVTPLVIAGNLLAKDFFLIVANITLALGHLANYYLRVRAGDVARTEILLVLAILGLSITVAFTAVSAALTLPVSAWLCLLLYINVGAIVVNAFFFVKSVIVQPMLDIIKHFLSYLGLEINTNSYSVMPLAKFEEEAIFNLSLEELYCLDDAEFQQEPRLKQYNIVNVILTNYLNKYSSALFGAVLNGDKIERLKKARKDFFCHGKRDSTYGFISDKLVRKFTKIRRMLRVREQMLECCKQAPDASSTSKLHELLAQHTNFRRHKDQTPTAEEIEGIFKCSYMQKQQTSFATLIQALPSSHRVRASIELDYDMRELVGEEAKGEQRIELNK